MIFFDIDHTLLDHAKAERLALTEFYNTHQKRINQPFDEFAISWHRHTLKWLEAYLDGTLTFEQQRIHRVKHAVDLNLTDTEAHTLFQDYLQPYQQHWCLFDDVLPCLQQLAEHHRLGIISDGNEVQQKKKLLQTGIMDYFDVVVITGTVGVGKPHPKVFHTALELGKKQAKECTYIGDSLEKDIEGARGVGMRSVWVNRAGLKHDGQVDVEVRTLDNILSLL